MLSNHYSFTYSAPNNWVVLVLMMLAGALIRQYFVMRHGYKLGRNGNPLPYALIGVVIIAAMIVVMRPAPQPVEVAAAPAPTPTYAELQPVLVQRCYMCHGAQVQMKGLRFDSPEMVKQHAQQIYQQVVVTKIMPMNNATQITDAERGLIKRWFEGGAP